MAGQDDKFEEIFDRLRETEAQTREQNQRISALCDRLDNFTTVTDKFFELEDKRHEADEKRFLTLCEHEKRLSEKAEQREEKMWKVLVMLIGAVLVSTLGQRAANEVYKAWIGKTGPVVEHLQPALPMNTHENYLGNFTKKTA